MELQAQKFHLFQIPLDIYSSNLKKKPTSDSINFLKLTI